MKFYVADVGLWLCLFALPSFASCILIAYCTETYAKTQSSTTSVLHLKCSILPNDWHFDYFHQSFLLVNKTISAAVNMLIFLCYHDDGLTFIAHSFALPLPLFLSLSQAFSFSDIRNCVTCLNEYHVKGAPSENIKRRCFKHRNIITNITKKTTEKPSISNIIYIQYMQSKYTTHSLCNDFDFVQKHVIGISECTEMGAHIGFVVNSNSAHQTHFITLCK